MKLYQPTTAFVVLLSLSSSAGAFNIRDHGSLASNEAKNLPALEGNEFWSRYLGLYSFSLPPTPPPRLPSPPAQTPPPVTPPPTVSPLTPLPTPLVTLLPTPPPIVSTGTPPFVPPPLTTSPTSHPIVPPSCLVAVNTTCSSQNGVACTEIRPPSGLCSTGKSLTSLRFTYVANTCGKSQNAQGAAAACQDYNRGPVPSATGVVTCTAPDGSILFSSTALTPGSSFIVSGKNGGSLPQFITCGVTAQDTTPWQLDSIDVSGDVKLFLKNQFGAFELEACTNVDHQTEDCLLKITYTFDLSNVGPVSTKIDSFEISKNSQTSDMIGFVPQSNLTPGMTTEVTAGDTIDSCVPASYQVDASVTARPPLGLPCFGSFNYSFDVLSSLTPAPTPAPTAEKLTPAPVTPLPTLTPTPPPRTLPPLLPPTSAPVSPPTPPPASPPISPPVSVSPTVKPPSSPTAISSPTRPPSPNLSCLLDLNLDCQPPEGATSCNKIPPVVTQCLQRPTEITMLLYGGNCSQSFNMQSSILFRCFDSKSGPPTTPGSQVFIVATDTKGQGITYFSGFVNIGTTYTLSDNGNQVDANMNITIYSSSNLSPTNVLETLVYHSSCSSRNLFLGDRFGASQLVAFRNNAQGDISLFQNANFQFSIKLPFTLTGSATLTSLVSVTNFLGVLNFTRQVAGLKVSAGQEIILSQPIPLDLTERRRYTAVTTLTGVISTGQSCSASDVTTFIAGNPAIPGFPTIAPTGASGATPSPTTNPLTSPCRLRTLIRCVVPNREFFSCDALSAPSTTACSGDSFPSYLQFRYVGGDGLPDTVFVSIVSNHTIFEGFVNKFGFINAYGNYRSRSVPIVFSNTPNGTVLASFDVPTACNGSDLILYKNYGGVLQLSGFANNVTGLVNGFAAVQLDYVLQNDGDAPITVTSASIASAFSGNNTLLPSPVSISGKGEVDLGNETAVLNLQSAAGKTLNFGLSASGSASGTGFPCFDVSGYALSVR